MDKITNHIETVAYVYYIRKSIEECCRDYIENHHNKFIEEAKKHNPERVFTNLTEESNEDNMYIYIISTIRKYYLDIINVITSDLKEWSSEDIKLHTKKKATIFNVEYNSIYEYLINQYRSNKDTPAKFYLIAMMKIINNNDNEEVQKNICKLGVFFNSMPEFNEQKKITYAIFSYIHLRNN